MTELPSNVQFLWPKIGQGLGVLLMMLGAGYQSTAKESPDKLPGWMANPDVATLFGAAIAAGSLLVGHGNDQKAKAAHDAALHAPPVNGDGETGSQVTGPALVSQLMAEQKHDVAAAVLRALDEDSGCGTRREPPRDGGAA